MISTHELDTSADFGAETKGTLHMVGGAAKPHDRRDHRAAALPRTVPGLIPVVADQDGAVTVRYPKRPHPLTRNRGDATLELSNRIPWDLHVNDAAAYLTATLTGLTLTSITFDAAIADITLDLPHPAGQVSIRIDGPVRNLQLRRPAGIAVSVRIDGGARNIRVDGKEVGAIGRGYRHTPPPTGPDHYTLAITGAVDDLTVAG